MKRIDLTCPKCATRPILAHFNRDGALASCPSCDFKLIALGSKTYEDLRKEINKYYIKAL